MRLAVGLLAGVALLVLVLQLTRNVIVIEEFDVPQELARHGWTGRVVAKRLLDQLRHIERNASTQMERPPFASSWTHAPADVEIAGAKISLSSLAQQLRELIGRDSKRINGEVLYDGNKLVLVVRLKDDLARTFSSQLHRTVPVDALDPLLASAAQYVFERSEPFLLASYFFATGDKRTLETVEICLRNNSAADDPWAYNLWGLMLFDDGLYPEAEEKFARAITLKPDFHPAYNNWGLTLLHSGEPAKSELKFQRAVELNPTAYTYTNWAKALIERQKYDRAIETLAQAIRLDERYAPARISLSQCYRAKGDLKKARAIMEEAVLINPDFADSHRELALVLRSLKLEDRAARQDREVVKRLERFYRRAKEVNPASARTHFSLAVLLEIEYRLGEAEAEYRRAIELDEDLAPAYNGLGTVLLAFRRYDEAAESFQMAVRIDPRSMAYRKNLGDALLKTGAYQEAIDQLDLISPKGHATYVSLGSAFFKLARFEDALEQFRRAQRLAPGNREVNQNLCVTLTRLARPHQAARHCATSQAKSGDPRPAYLSTVQNRP